MRKNNGFDFIIIAQTTANWEVFLFFFSLVRADELYSANGQVGFVATERVDGKVILPEGIQLLKMKGATN